MPNCPNLQESHIIPEGDGFGLVSLYDLDIVECGLQNSFPAGGFLAARNLTTLSLSRCNGLSSLPQGMAASFPSLKFLSISFCPLSTSFPEDDFPAQLQTMHLVKCSKLESLSENVSTCTSLLQLLVSRCGILSFPTRGLPPNLLKLKIESCSKIKAFPQGGLPPSLESLHTESCEVLDQNYADWQLNKLTCLQKLVFGRFSDNLLGSLEELIIGNDSPSLESFPPDGSLPTSLTVFHIFGFNKLRSICCRELQCIPSLRELEIRNCWSLRSFLDGDLPQSLCRLTIKDSPLVERCRKRDGHYIDKTSHITCLELGR